MPHFQTPGLTRRARIPRGARPALGEPEASPGGPPLEPYKFPPQPGAGIPALFPPLKAPPLIPLSRREQTTASPPSASALLEPFSGQSLRLTHYAPTPAQTAPKVVRTPQTSLLRP